MAEAVGRGARALRWGGKVPAKCIELYHAVRGERVVVCRTHHDFQGEHFFRKAFRPGIDPAGYLPERVLEGLHLAPRFREHGTGHFTSGPEPVTTLVNLSSLFTVRAGTIPFSFDDYVADAAVDTDAINLEALRAETSAEDVFQDWPLKFMMISGYSMWCMPREVYEKMAYHTQTRATDSLLAGGELHYCKERVVFDREMYIRRRMVDDDLLLNEAEKAADRVPEFKVAVELDMSFMGRPNCVFFLPPRDAKDPNKVVEEIGNPRLREVSIRDLDMSEMRLVPHPRFDCCDQTNWFKVIPKGRVAYWEKDLD